MYESWEETKARLRQQGVYVAVPQFVAPAVIQQRYNVHKRSLPVGIDKIVAHNVSMQEAERMMANILKTKCSQSGMLTYYDIIACDAAFEETSVYFNPALFVLDNEKGIN